MRGLTVSNGAHFNCDNFVCRALETKQKKEYNRLKGWRDSSWKTWGFQNFKPWVTQSHPEKEKKHTRTDSKTHQECFWDFGCRSTYFQTAFISASPKRSNQTLLYGYPLNTETSFITDWTVYFISWGKALKFSLNSTCLIQTPH